MAPAVTDQQDRILDELHHALDSGTALQVAALLRSMRPVEIARLLEASPPPTRRLLWEILDDELEAEVIHQMADEVQLQLVRDMSAEELVQLGHSLDTDDLADLLQQLPERMTHDVLAAMTAQDRSRVEQVLAYDEETAGGLMNLDAITVRAKFTLDVVLRYLRRHDALPAATDNLFVVNQNDELVGILPISKILTTDPSVTVGDVMLTDIEALPADMPDYEVAKQFERNDWISAPVVNEYNRLIGRITIDDIVDVIREDADHSLMSLAGLDEDIDTFTTVKETLPRRALWLGVNMITATLAASVISLFEATLDKVIALAILMPIVASMGGVAGSQTLTVVIRGIALGHVSKRNSAWLLWREVRVGFINGLLIAAMMGTLVYFWFDSLPIAIIIGTALIVNQTVAAIAGTLVPITLKALNVDPALAGGVALTTLTDMLGFFVFLGLATYFYF